MDKKNKEFFLSSWAINNKTIIYVLMTIFLVSGITAYKTMPRELFPEINSSNIFVTTIFPGNNAEEIEKLITDPLEQEIKGVIGLIEIESTSSEGISIINIEFDDDIPTEVARLRVKDLVDNVTVGDDWPTFNNAKVDPNIFEFDIAERFPVLNISLVGNYRVEELKEYAEYLDTRIERLPQVKTVEVRGIQDFEVEIAVNPYKMKATKTSFGNIINAISQENITISAGSLISDGQRRNVKIIGEVSDPSQLNRLIVKRDDGPVYLEDVASVTLSTKSFTLSLATSVGMSSSNSIFIIDIPSLDVDSISISPITPLISCSNGSVINFSISSALFPGKIVVTKIFEELISGNNSLGIVLYAVIPETKKIVIKT